MLIINCISTIGCIRTNRHEEARDNEPFRFDVDTVVFVMDRSQIPCLSWCGQQQYESLFCSFGGVAPRPVDLADQLCDKMRSGTAGPSRSSLPLCVCLGWGGGVGVNWPQALINEVANHLAAPCRVARLPQRCPRLTLCPEARCWCW